MPKRSDIKTILIVGAGPIVIGQACEFDYSGTQACKALKNEGYKIILVNSNPATIMTDPDVADKTYIEPITPEIIKKIIKKEKPDAILPTMGGQTGLNVSLEVSESGGTSSEINFAPKDSICSPAANLMSYPVTSAPNLLVVAIACRPATPAPKTSIEDGGIVPAAVIIKGRYFLSEVAAKSPAL